MGSEAAERLNDTPVACQTHEVTDPQRDGSTALTVTDEVPPQQSSLPLACKGKVPQCAHWGG